MDRSYPYSRRLVSRARLRKRMAAVAAAGLVAAASAFMLAWKPDPISAAVPAPFMPVAGLGKVFGAGEPLRQGVRRIYPYSVVPGGVSGQAELKRIIRTDSVVAAHFASFDTGKARALVVAKPRAVHVSYRKGDKVYWTAHKVMLAPGETLLSDGRNEMRARCANRISELPQYPVEAHKPTMEELDQPVELAEGEHYTLGSGGMPVVMGGEGAIGRHTGVRFPTRGGSGGGSTGSGSPGTPADSMPASSLFSGSGSMGPVTTIGLSGSSSSMGSPPRPPRRPASATAPEPAPAPETSTAPAPAPDAGSGTSSGSSGSPAPSGSGTAPVAEPVTEAPVSSPVPGTTAPQPPERPTVDPKPEPSAPAPVPGSEPASLPVTEEPPAPPSPPSGPSGSPPPSEPGPQPVAPKPAPLPPQPIEDPAPAEVPEPGSIWLFGLALAAMGVLRRLRRG